MSFILTAFRLNLKRIVLGKSFILIMLLLPASVFGCISFLQREASVLSIKVGIVYDEQNELSQRLFDSLLDNKEISFEQFENSEEGRAELESMIKTGKLECGYIIHDDMAAQIKKGNLAGLITLVKSPQTVADAAINEMFYSAFVKTATAEITTAEIRKAFKGLDYDQIKRLIDERVAEYYGQDIFVKGNYSYENGVYVEQTEQTNPFPKRLLHGIIALFLLISVVFMLPRFIDEKKSSFLRKLGFAGACRYYFSLFLSMFFANFIFGAVSIYIIKYFYPQALSGLSAEIAVLSLYTAAICTMGVFIVGLLKKSDWIYASSIFVLIITVSLGGIVFDVGEIVPMLSKISDCFPTSSYINYIIFARTECIYVLSAMLLTFFAGSLFAIFANQRAADV